MTRQEFTKWSNMHLGDVEYRGW